MFWFGCIHQIFTLGFLCDTHIRQPVFVGKPLELRRSVELQQKLVTCYVQWRDGKPA